MTLTPTLAQLIQDAVRTGILDINVCLPARIETYDAELQKANVMPLLKKKYVDQDEPTALPVISNVPVQWYSANDGAAFIHLPLIIGDLGMIVFSQRSLDIWLSGEGEIINPNDPRMCDISDAIFIAGVRPFKKALQGITASSLMIKNGAALIEQKEDGTINVEDGSGAQVELSGGNVTILGGTIDLGSGAEKAVLGDTLKTLYEAHTHPGVQTGGGVTGIPSNVLDSALSGKVNVE